MKQLDRRSFVRQAGLLSLLACLPPAVLAQIISRTPPISPFGADSTAEQVTAGLDLSGKTYAITGANSGLGYETMRVLALRGAHVIGIARSMDKAREACASVPGKTTPAFLDLGDFASVVSCAGEIRAMNTPLDGLICNAGIMALPERELVYGMEKQFVVNHLGHFILVNQLMAAVTAAPQGRFVILSSAAHRRAPSDGIRFDDLAFANSDYDAWTAYGHSKLANALCARELARRLSGTSTTANSVHPGVINTNLGRQTVWLGIHEEYRGGRGHPDLCGDQPGPGGSERLLFCRLQSRPRRYPADAGRRHGQPVVAALGGTHPALPAGAGRHSRITPASRSGWRQRPPSRRQR